MVRTRAAEPTQIALRVSSDVVERADTLVAIVSRDPRLAIGRVTRSSLLKLALLRGLESLEQEYH